MNDLERVIIDKHTCHAGYVSCEQLSMLEKRSLFCLVEAIQIRHMRFGRLDLSYLMLRTNEVI